MPYQFDVTENLNPDSRSEYPLLVILQHDRVSFVGTTVVAPLVHLERAPSPSRLQPAVSVADKQYIVLLGQLAAVPKGMIGDVVDSLEDHRYFLVAGLDLLFTGI